MIKKIWGISGPLSQNDIEWINRSKLECTLGELSYLVLKYDINIR